MQSNINQSLGSYNIDRQLIAAVQINAGARCHESANLLNCYQLCAQVYRDAIDCQDEEEVEWALKILQDSEVKLRMFLFQCRRPPRMRECDLARSFPLPDCGGREIRHD